MKEQVEKLQNIVTERKSHWDQLSKYIDRIERGKISTFSPEELKELGTLYRKATSDLAYLQTYFGPSKVTFFLNQLVARAYSNVYRPKFSSRKKIYEFFLRGFPKIFRKNINFFIVSTTIFFTSMFFAFLTTLYSPDFARLFLSSCMIESIHDGRMWTESIFSVTPPSVASSTILTNNISVTFITFVLGITLGIGTVYILMINGMIMGTVSSLCWQYGIAGPFWTFVLPHGIIELCAIFIAGGSGLILGNTLINPGDYSRQNALKIRGKEAIMLIVGGIPLLIIAGIIEGFISPSPYLPPLVKIVFSLAIGLILYLYLLYEEDSKKDGNNFTTFLSG